MIDGDESTYWHSYYETKDGKNINIATGVTIGIENRGKRKGTPTIGDDCWIGTNVRICKGVTIGDNSIVAACSVVTKDVPANCIVAGNPAKIVKTGIDVE